MEDYIPQESPCKTCTHLLWYDGYHCCSPGILEHFGEEYTFDLFDPRRMAACDWWEK